MLISSFPGYESKSLPSKTASSRWIALFWVGAGDRELVPMLKVTIKYCNASSEGISGILQVFCYQRGSTLLQPVWADIYLMCPLKNFLKETFCQLCQVVYFRAYWWKEATARIWNLGSLGLLYLQFLSMCFFLNNFGFCFFVILGANWHSKDYSCAYAQFL